MSEPSAWAEDRARERLPDAPMRDRLALAYALDDARREGVRIGLEAAAREARTRGDGDYSAAIGADSTIDARRLRAGADASYGIARVLERAEPGAILAALDGEE